MLAALEAEGLLPRPPITLKTVDRESVKAIILAEDKLLKRANQLGIDADEAHVGYKAHVEAIIASLADGDRAEFERLFVEESLQSEELDATLARLAATEQDYAKAVEESKPPSTLRVFMAGVNVTVLAAVALYFLMR